MNAWWRATTQASQSAPSIGTVGPALANRRLFVAGSERALLPNPARAWGARLGGLVGYTRLAPRLRSMLSGYHA